MTWVGLVVAGLFYASSAAPPLEFLSKQRPVPCVDTHKTTLPHARMKTPRPLVVCPCTDCTDLTQPLSCHDLRLPLAHTCAYTRRHLFCPSVAVTVLGQASVHVASLAVLLGLAKPWLEGAAVDGWAVPDGDFRPNLLNSLVFILAGWMQVPRGLAAVAAVVRRRLVVR